MGNARKRQKLKLMKGPKFSDSDAWEMGFVLARICAKGVHKFRFSARCGYPSFLTEESWEDELKEIEWALNEVANNYPSDPWNQGFSKWIKDEKNSHSTYEADEETKERSKEYFERIKKGLHLFVDRMETMWD